MHAARHDAAHSRNQFRLLRHRDDAGGGADHINDVAFAATRAQRIPVRVKSAYGNRNAGAKAELLGPFRREVAREMVRRLIVPGELLANPIQQRIDFRQKRLRRQASPFRIPHPLVAHRAYAAFRLPRIRNAAQCRRHHVAVLESRRELAALVRIVTQPVQQLGESPFVRVHSAAPLDRLEVLLVRERRDLLSLGFGPMIAPQVVLVQRLHEIVHRDDAGACGVERDGSNLLPMNSGGFDSGPCRFRQSAHVIRVRLRGEIRIFALAMEWVLGNRSAEAATIAGENGDPHRESAKVDACDDSHGVIRSGKAKGRISSAPGVNIFPM